MRCALLLFLASMVSVGQQLPGTARLDMKGDIAEQMVNGIIRHLERATTASASARKPSVERLKYILGVADARTGFDSPELIAALNQPALLADAGAYKVYAVRWPVTPGMTAEGLLFAPTGEPKARVVAVPDADQLPEQFEVSQKLAAAGCEVLSFVLINRKDTWSGNPAIRMTNQPHREFLYRMSFEIGRTPWGYETEKALAAIDHFARQSPKPIGIWGYGEGGAIATFLAALDRRVQAVGISGYFGPREKLAKQPLYRNTFGLLSDFGDAELLAMARVKTIIVDRNPGPVWDGPSTADPKRRGAAPMKLSRYSPVEIESEFQRLQRLHPSATVRLETEALPAFMQALSVPQGDASKIRIPVRDADGRQKRQFEELAAFSQELVRKSWFVRQALWAKTEHLSPERWSAMAPEYRSKLWDGPIGRLPKSSAPLNVRTRKSWSDPKWDGYEVVYDVAPDVFGYGVLLVPKGIGTQERRPVVVAQHGLEGRPTDMFACPEIDRKPDGSFTGNFHYYQNVGSRLAERGYVVYMPQNPYIGDFRPINRLANPLGLSLFSFILAQHDRMLDWISSLPYVRSVEDRLLRTVVWRQNRRASAALT